MKNDSVLSDKELINIIEENNQEMQRLINQNPNDLYENKNDIEKLFLTNVSYCVDALHRKIKVPNVNFMMAIATILGYEIDNSFRIKNTNKLTKRR